MEIPKIVRVDARAVNVPLEYPVRTSVGIVDTAPLVLIDLHTNSGVVGRSYVFTYTPLALAATREMVRSLGTVLEGRAAAPAELDRLFASRLRLLGRTGIVIMACAGLDMALWDALAVHAGMPLVSFLGGAARPVIAYDSHSMDGIEVGTARAGKAAAAGYKAIKTKIGYATLDEDLHVLKALRRSVGPKVQIMVDYNQGLSVPEATWRIHVLEAEDVGWVEEPTVQEDLRGHAQIRSTSRLPIQMGENWCGPEEMQRALEAGACDLAMPDIMKIGGVTGWLKAAALAQVHNIPMSSHIFPEFSAHVLPLTPTAHFLERMDLAGPILGRKLDYVDGFAVTSDAPGAGIDWDESAIARYAS
ncbi:MAG: mandelate racemase [Proteobacteria bacterium]|nr:mandelate racemase [Pseudomonadota bacterium]